MIRPDKPPRLSRRRLLTVWISISAALVVGVFAAPAIVHAAQSMVEAVSFPARPDDVKISTSFESFEATWSPAANAARYDFVVATDAAMAHVIASQAVSEPRMHVDSLHSGNRYYFQVRSINSAGTTGDFTTPKPVTTKFHSVSAPTGITVTAVSTTAVEVAWTKAAWATGYVITRSTDRRGASSDKQYTTGDVNSMIIPGIPEETTGRNYVFTVAATNPGHRSSPSDPVDGNTLPSMPESVTIAATSPLGVTVTWRPSTNAQAYVVERSTSPTFEEAVSVYRVSSAYTRLSINDLTPGEGGYFRVYAMNGNAVGPASPEVSGGASTKPAITVRAGTYNVINVRYDSLNGFPWSERRARVAALINDSHLDVLGVQEATTGRLTPKDPKSISQVVDLVSLTKPKLTRSKAGSLGTHILYNAKKYKAEKYGVFTLPKFPGDTTRAAVWQVLRDIKTNARFLVLNTHLTNAPGASQDAIRRKQAEAMLAHLRSINPDHLPVIVTGDLNSFDDRAPVTPMSLFAAKGYTDADLSAATRANGDYNSLSQFGDPVRAETGTKLDHILTSESIGVAYYEVVLELDGSGRMRDPEASDHRPIITELRVPVVK